VQAGITDQVDLQAGVHVLMIDCPRMGGATNWGDSEDWTLAFDLEVSRSLKSSDQAALH
jgi:hypothetical protein